MHETTNGRERLKTMRTILTSSTMKIVFSFLIVIVLITLPTYLVATQPQSYNPLTQVLFDLLLFIASLWFAVTISGKEARKTVTDKWLPAAETACNELLTIGATIERMRCKQIRTCQAIELIFPGVSSEKLAPIRQLVRMRCEDCASTLGSLKDHVENSFRNWEVFINSNCEQGECEYIHSRLAERRYMLEMAIQGVPSEAISQDVIAGQ